ncbi:3299_t:CDS:1 [Funneliformis geosporum]|uniref:Phosphoserine aminotransferase n=1 Tax=Funneliformis geosporum TaxID=1117311 RepID=A0A9W4STB1_9GLOM|nr:7137_t:CDS:1 [Funneliformis geosporum]CAI2186254.1 3299_t:CDS:1 [Funneliformis geosporum]
MSSTKPKVYNFGAGPAAIPLCVLEKAQKDLLNYENTGMSVMEISHRSKTFDNLLNKAKQDLKTLLQVPDNYSILFMQGGGLTQFSAIVYNLLAAKRQQIPGEEFNPPLDYFVTGSWSAKAADEAKRLYNNVNIVIDVKKSKGSFESVPPKEEWKLSGSKAAFVYYCDNETINGVEFPFIPEVDPSVPLVCDMSSNILSRKFDVSKFGVIYAGAQKNIGTSGVTVVIVRDDLLVKPNSVNDQEKGVPVVPVMLSYKIIADHNSVYNTPPMFPIYISGLVFEWLLDQGGVEAIEKINNEKSKKVYGLINNSKIYRSPIEKPYRSRMNAPFRIIPEELEKEFLTGAEELGMVQLKGHRSVGGIRVSMYNAVTLEAIDLLTNYMIEFEKKHS